MLLRWLLPVIALVALLGNAVNAFAAAGMFERSTCCCPNPKLCKCHDHDDPRPDDTLQKCGGDAAKVAPALQTVIVPEVRETVQVVTQSVVEHATIIAVDQIVSHPEKPPF